MQPICRTHFLEACEHDSLRDGDEASANSWNFRNFSHQKPQKNQQVLELWLHFVPSVPITSRQHIFDMKRHGFAYHRAILHLTPSEALSIAPCACRSERNHGQFRCSYKLKKQSFTAFWGLWFPTSAARHVGGFLHKQETFAEILCPKQLYVPNFGSFLSGRFWKLQVIESKKTPLYLFAAHVCKPPETAESSAGSRKQCVN